MALPNNPTQLEVVKAIKDLEGGAIIELEENGSTTAGTWLAKTDKITALQDGQLFLYKIAVAGATTTTLNITANGTALGAITIYRVGTTKLTTQYGVGQYLLLIYNTTNSCFRVVNDYDANSYAYVRQYQAGANAAGSGTKYPVLTRYNLTNKNGSYDTAYSRYHTGVTVDTSNGNLDAPTISENGTALSSKYALASAVPTKTSELTNDSGFLTSHLTSINGLAGGQLTSALYLSGGDAVSGAANIQLDTNGQITAKGTTSTLFGRNSSTTLLVGHSSHALTLRGSATRPTYNGNALALSSDIPTFSDVKWGDMTLTYVASSGNTAVSIESLVGNGTLSSSGKYVIFPAQTDTTYYGWEGQNKANSAVVNSTCPMFCMISTQSSQLAMQVYVSTYSKVTFWYIKNFRLYRVTIS